MIILQFFLIFCNWNLGSSYVHTQSIEEDFIYVRGQLEKLTDVMTTKMEYIEEQNLALKKGIESLAEENKIMAEDNKVIIELLRGGFDKLFDSKNENLTTMIKQAETKKGDSKKENLTTTINKTKTEKDEVLTFLGNQTYSDYFKLLRQDEDTLLIGARNILYNISLATLEENQESRITWESTEIDRSICYVKGKNEYDCHNYIRVLATVDSNKLLVCGTNSYKPQCRNYESSWNTLHEFKVVHEFSGRGYCPYDPRHNSTFIFTDGELYSGTVSDFAGYDALIYRDPIRTQQYNLKQLNGPDFVNSIEDKEFVYFFFREDAVEYMNCGKSIYSRVGRVCKKDKGGPYTFRNKWTTFLKARLNCSVPGTYPFYFNELQAVTHQVISNPEDGPIVYAVFNTPENSIKGSAVCSFKLSDIRASFDGEFKAQEDVNSNWLPLANHKVSEIRPGSCHNDSNSLDEEHINFLQENILMDKAVPSSVNMPHFIKTSQDERLTAIAVDSNVLTSSGEKVDMLFVGTTKGKVLKLANMQGGITHLVEEMQMFPIHVAVNNVLVVRDIRRLIVISDHEIKSVPID